MTSKLDEKLIEKVENIKTGIKDGRCVDLVLQDLNVFVMD